MLVEPYTASRDPEDIQYDCYDCGAHVDKGVCIRFTEEKPIYLDNDCVEELIIHLNKIKNG